MSLYGIIKFLRNFQKGIDNAWTVLYNVNIASDKQLERSLTMTKRKKQLKKAMEWRKYWFIELGGTRSLYRTAYNGRYANMA